MAPTPGPFLPLPPGVVIVEETRDSCAAAQEDNRALLKQGQPLPPDIALLAEAVFGDALDCSKVSVVDKRLDPMVEGRTRGNLVLVNSTYDTPETFPPDTYLHELMHVVQWQSYTTMEGPRLTGLEKGFEEIVLLEFRNGPLPLKDPYRLEHWLKPGSTVRDVAQAPIEAQAELIEQLLTRRLLLADAELLANGAVRPALPTWSGSGKPERLDEHLRLRSELVLLLANPMTDPSRFRLVAKRPNNAEILRDYWSADIQGFIAVRIRELDAGVGTERRRELYRSLLDQHLSDPELTEELMRRDPRAFFTHFGLVQDDWRIEAEKILAWSDERIERMLRDPALAAHGPSVERFEAKRKVQQAEFERYAEYLGHYLDLRSRYVKAGRQAQMLWLNRRAALDWQDALSRIQKENPLRGVQQVDALLAGSGRDQPLWIAPVAALASDPYARSRPDFPDRWQAALAEALSQSGESIPVLQTELHQAFAEQRAVRERLVALIEKYEPERGQSLRAQLLDMSLPVEKWAVSDWEYRDLAVDFIQAVQGGLLKEEKVLADELALAIIGGLLEPIDPRLRAGVELPPPPAREPDPEDAPKPSQDPRQRQEEQLFCLRLESALSETSWKWLADARMPVGFDFIDGGEWTLRANAEGDSALRPGLVEGAPKLRLRVADALRLLDGESAVGPIMALYSSKELPSWSPLQTIATAARLG